MAGRGCRAASRAASTANVSGGGTSASSSVVVGGADEQAVLAQLDDQRGVGVQQLAGRARDAVEHALLVEVVGEAGDGGDEPVERVGLLEQVARELALEGDRALGVSALTARAREQRSRARR